MNYSEKIINILKEVKENPDLSKNYNENSSIIDDVGLDSLEMINFVLRIEEEFNMDIDFNEFDFSYFDKVESFADFIKYYHFNSSCRAGD